MIDWLLSQTNFDDVRSKLQDRGTYTIEIYADGLDIDGSSKLTEDKTLGIFNVSQGSSKVIGTIKIQ